VAQSRIMQDIGAVILAAGESSRFGRPKQLLQFRGRSLVRRVADAAGEAGCEPIAVVTGSEAEKIRAELRGARLKIFENQNWRAGIAGSIRLGVQGLIDIQPKLKAIVLLVCDQPLVDAGAVRQLIALREKTSKAIVASGYSATLGVPALFDRSCFPELLALEYANGAKSIILRDHKRVAKFPFPKGKIDIDTLDDYEKLIGT
jgi:molybdenum cofactor cytidylyltransferase